MKRNIPLFAAVALLTLLGYFVWPTPYRYIVLPGVPEVLRISRVTGRVWRLERSDLLWFSRAEYDEIARRSSGEIKRRCDKAEREGAFKAKSASASSPSTNDNDIDSFMASRQAKGASASVSAPSPDASDDDLDSFVKSRQDPQNRRIIELRGYTFPCQ